MASSLEQFERQLAADKEKEVKHSSRKRHRSRSRDRDRYRERDPDRHKKRRSDRDDHRRHHRSSRHDHHHESRRARASPDSDDYEQPEAMDYPHNDETLDEQLEEVAEKSLKRDAWMVAPSELDLDYVPSRRREEEKSKFVIGTTSEPEKKRHKNEIDTLLKELGEEERANQEVKDESSCHEVSYEFGDSGSSWRMTKLKGVYRRARETGRSVEEIASETYGDLREYDEAREEEIELDRRKAYGKEYVGKTKPSGDLFEERRILAGLQRAPRSPTPDPPVREGVMEELPPLTKTVALDQTALNKLKAQMMKAKLRNAPEAAKLEAEYNEAMATAANSRDPEFVVLNAMENRMLTSGRKGEVKSIDNKRGRERGLVEENDEMSLEDMVRHERRTKGGQRTEGLALAERIAKDSKFTNDLDYMDENASKLAKYVAKSDINLHNVAINEFQKMERILENCPLCHHEDRAGADALPAAPIVSLGTRVYLTLATEPEISTGGAVIAPIAHHANLLEADDDEWEELRNFMKALTRMYHAHNRSVIFYENAASSSRRMHAAMVAVPIPLKYADTVSQFFREAMLSADEEWSQHKKIIDTGKKALEVGRSAFRRSIAKEVPYFHVWFTLDGGLGHVVEDERKWPKGDLFAREIIGGMLDVMPDVVKRQGRWHRQDPRVATFRKQWRKYDWTRVLVEGQ